MGFMSMTDGRAGRDWHKPRPGSSDFLNLFFLCFIRRAQARSPSNPRRTPRQSEDAKSCVSTVGGLGMVWARGGGAVFIFVVWGGAATPFEFPPVLFYGRTRPCVGIFLFVLQYIDCWTERIMRGRRPDL